MNDQEDVCALLSSQQCYCRPSYCNGFLYQTNKKTKEGFPEDTLPNLWSNSGGLIHLLRRRNFIYT